jgi:hypothetical protein
MLRIRVVLAWFLTLFLLGSYAAGQAPPVKAPDPDKAALIEELIVALKAEQNQQQVMQAFEGSMLNQINRMLDSELKNLGGAADAEKKRQLQADVQDFQRRLFALMAPAGQVYVDKMPAMVANTMKRMQGVMSDMTPDIQKLNADFMQELRQKYADKN